MLLLSSLLLIYYGLYPYNLAIDDMVFEVVSEFSNTIIIFYSTWNFVIFLAVINIVCFYGLYKVFYFFNKTRKLLNMMIFYLV